MTTPRRNSATERQAAHLRANNFKPKVDEDARFRAARRKQGEAQRKAATGDDARGAVSSATIIQARLILERNGQGSVEVDDDDDLLDE